MTPLTLLVIKSALLPAALVALGCWLVSGLGQGLRSRLQATLIACGFVAGGGVLLNLPHWPPADINESLMWAAPLLALFVWIVSRSNGRYFMKIVFTLALGFLAFWSIRSTLTSMIHLRNLAAFFFLGLGVWSIVERSEHWVSSLTHLTLPLLAALSLTFMLMISGSAVLSQLLSIICAVTGFLMLLVLCKPASVSAHAISPFISVFVILFMAVGHFYLDMNPWRLVPFAIPYLVLWLGPLLPFVPKRPLGEALTLGVLSAAPLAYFLWTAYQAAGSLF